MIMEIKKCTIKDLKDLQEISAETFRDTFQEQNTKEDLKTYIETAYNLETLRSELLTKDTSFYFLQDEDKLAGYLKINMNEAQTENKDNDSLEIERIYIQSNFKGKGYGRALINKAIEIAQENKKTILRLGVWEHNFSAQVFYEKMGFVKIGAHSFFMGEDEQLDFIMTKELS